MPLTTRDVAVWQHSRFGAYDEKKAIEGVRATPSQAPALVEYSGELKRRWIALEASYEDTTLLEMARKAGVTIRPGVFPLDKEVKANGLRLHYLDWGNAGKPTLLFLHGRAQTAHMWDYSCLALRDRYHCIALDQRGHGDSQWATDGDYTLPAQQKDIEEFVKAADLSPFILVGLSMGGRNAYVYAAEHPAQVQALVIIDTGPERGASGQRDGQRESERLLALPDEADSFEEFVQGVKQNSPLRTIVELRESLKHSVRQLANGKWTWKHDLAFRAGRPSAPPPETEYLWRCIERIRVPTLIVRGGMSNVLPESAAQRMVRTIPSCQLVTIERAGHRVPGDAPAAFERALAGFLERLPSTS